MNSTTIVRALLAATMLLALGAQAQSNVYRWVDKSGKVHFSDTPPAEEAKSVSQKRVGGGYVQESSLPYATQVATKRNPVTLYTDPKCATPCERARDLLSERGIPFSERNAASKEGAEALQKAIGSTTVPALIVGERNYRGFDDDAWQAALDAGGYPRTALPGQAEAVRQASKPPAPAVAPGKAAAAEPSAGK
jgi:glutaredoxin